MTIAPPAQNRDQLVGAASRLRAEVQRRIVGQTQVLDEILMSLIAGGHALLVGVPGLAKTLMVRSLAQAVHLEFRRIQFTPDLVPRLWGALFLNADFHRTAQAVAEVLAHESAHSLLFGFCTDSALVENSDDERYNSPLRTDPRPMDGIYHATFVSARMHWAMSRLLEARVLDDEATEATRGARDADVRNFWSGYEVVAEHGRLTDLGRALMNEAHAYMETVTQPQ